MRRDSLITVTLLNWLPLAALFTGAALTLVFVLHLDMRMAADDPQVRMAEDAAAALAGGAGPEGLAGGENVDLGRSLAPFVIVLDARGRPLAGSATLDGRIPVPPRGVLEFASAHGEERFTWQPRAGLRLASVVRRVADGGGYVVTGRSLREVERRKQIILGDVALAWVLGLGGLLALTFALAWLRRAGEDSAER